MKKKIFYKSKGFWSGLGSIGVGIFSIATGNVVQGILGIVAGGGAIFGRATATEPLTMNKAETVEGSVK